MKLKDYDFVDWWKMPISSFGETVTVGSGMKVNYILYGNHRF